MSPNYDMREAPTGFCAMCGAPSCDREHNAPNWPEISRLRNEMQRIQAAMSALEMDWVDTAHALAYQYELLRSGGESTGARQASPVLAEEGIQDEAGAQVPQSAVSRDSPSQDYAQRNPRFD